MTLKIRPSNLVFRFYLSDGWTKALVESMFHKCTARIAHPEDLDPYFVTDHTKEAVPNKEKILKECDIQHCWFWTEGENSRTQEQIIDCYY